MAANDALAAEIQLSRSQSKLQQISGINGESSLPLPMNQPLVSRYITHYEWYASRQLLPISMKGINQMLPRTYDLISLRAATVGHAENSRGQAMSAYKAGQLGIGDLLESGRNWQTSLQSFVGTVVSYNRAISDYALTITPAGKPIDQIESMLVSRPVAVPEIAQRNSVLRNSSVPTALPTTGRNRSADDTDRLLAQPAADPVNTSSRPSLGGGPPRSTGRNPAAAQAFDLTPQASRSPATSARPANQELPGGRTPTPLQGPPAFQPSTRIPAETPDGTRPGTSNQFNGGGGTFGGRP